MCACLAIDGQRPITSHIGKWPCMSAKWSWWRILYQLIPLLAQLSYSVTCNLKDLSEFYRGREFNLHQRRAILWSRSLRKVRIYSYRIAQFKPYRCKPWACIEQRGPRTVRPWAIRRNTFIVFCELERINFKCCFMLLLWCFGCPWA